MSVVSFTKFEKNPLSNDLGLGDFAGSKLSNAKRKEFLCDWRVQYVSNVLSNRVGFALELYA